MKYTDRSGAQSFQFVFHCDRCGAGVNSQRYAFNTAAFRLPLGQKARTLLWNRQHGEAHARAQHEARFEFNRCPVCGRRVCNECFHLSSQSLAGTCVDCREISNRKEESNPC